MLGIQASLSASFLSPSLPLGGVLFRHRKAETFVCYGSSSYIFLILLHFSHYFFSKISSHTSLFFMAFLPLIDPFVPCCPFPSSGVIRIINFSLSWSWFSLINRHGHWLLHLIHLYYLDSWILFFFFSHTKTGANYCSRREEQLVSKTQLSFCGEAFENCIQSCKALPSIEGPQMGGRTES